MLKNRGVKSPRQPKHHTKHNLHKTTHRTNTNITDKSKKHKSDVISPSKKQLKDGQFDREQFDQLILRKMIYIPSFEIYGGVAGLYDYGPAGCAIMANIQQQWRKQFIQQESMMEVSCSALTPEAVLRTSGHLQKFTDWMLKTVDSQQPLRADKILEDFLEGVINKVKQVPAEKFNADHQKRLNEAIRDKQLAGSMNGAALHQAIQRWEVKVNGEDLTEPEQFNLMFKSLIGPSGKSVAYLRPETAQGIFVNFKRLYDQSNKKLPFSVAQIGTSFRNEISPRGGLLRTREFIMAEIEHFVNPKHKDDARFDKIKSLRTTFLSAAAQQAVTNDEDKSSELIGDNMSFEEAVHGTQMVSNETLGFFLAKTHKFLTSIGISPDRIRFRQHMNTEMAHYAIDCWDAEILTSHGWIECVGHADRSAHDLSVHEIATKSDLSAMETLDTPCEVTKFVCKPVKNKLVPFAAKHPQIQPKDIITWADSLTEDQSRQIYDQIDTNLKQTQADKYPNGLADIPVHQLGAAALAFTVDVTLADSPEQSVKVTLDTSLLQPQIIQETISTRTFTPHVIEPSFGLGRILYSLLEQSYYVRPGADQRNVLRLPAHIAPSQLGIYSVTNNFDFDQIIAQLREKAIDFGLSVQVDTSRASIGKKYSRFDEIGLPYAISVDSDSLKEGNLVTIRERDSCTQVILGMDKAVGVVESLVKQRITWDEVRKTYKNVTPAAEEKM